MSQYHQPHPLLSLCHNRAALCLGLLAGICLLLAEGEVRAQPTETPPAATAAEETLELPSFDPKTEHEASAPVTLELLPETEAVAATAQKATQEAPPAEAAAAPVAPEPEPTPIVAEAPLAAIQVSQEEFGPAAAAPNAVAATESFGPPPPPQTLLDTAQELIGPLLPEKLMAKIKPKDTRSASEVTANLSADPLKGLLDDGWDDGSLMFSRLELQRLRGALLAPKEVPASEIAGTEVVAPNAPPPPEYLAFFVNSILYNTPESWIVWMNGRKLIAGKDSPLERIKIEKVSRGTVTFRWTLASRAYRPKDMSKLDDSVIRFQPDDTALITLRPNQTMMVDSLEIIEGRGYSHTVRTLLHARAAREAAQKQQQQMAAADGSVPAGIPPAAPSADNMNMDKMIGQYQKFQEMAPERPRQ